MRSAEKLFLRLRHAPIWSINIVKADTINGSVSKALLGLLGFHGCGYAAVYEGHGIISAVRIRTHTQTIQRYP
ncbi:MAG: hypothetical protein KKD47_10655, partial [Proteobacteria bacterium]|nr:hypothetical protein [Pseudomonadota bacterium]